MQRNLHFQYNSSKDTLSRRDQLEWSWLSPFKHVVSPSSLHLSSPSAFATMVYPQLVAPLEVLEHQQWKCVGPVPPERVKPLGALERGRLSALSITFTWASHQVFEVTTFHLVSERFFHFKEVEIQVKVIVRTDDCTPPILPARAASVSSQSFGSYCSKVLTRLQYKSLES